MPNNPDPVPTSVNLFPQQLIVATPNIPITINAPAFVDPVGNSFEFLSWNFQLRVLKKICSLPPSLNIKMKPSKCSIGGFLSLKKIFKTSQT
jgi:hypothetical protein